MRWLSWHADVTQFKAADGQLHYIYLVVDNFSKMILSWAVDIKLSAQIRVTTFREALKTAITIHTGVEAIKLIVDGGSENNNKTVDEFIASIKDIEISKLRALKDVCFTNSMAEAANRILKTYYLNHQHIENTQALLSITERSINDFNRVRPHGQLEGLTPYEAYTGKLVDKALLTTQMLEARRNRTDANRTSPCPGCTF